MARVGVLLPLLLGLAACGGSHAADHAADERSADMTGFSPDELRSLFGDTSKSWRVVQVYREYPDLVNRELAPCATDDVYIFHAESELVDVAFGETPCHYLIGAQSTEEAGGELTHVSSSGDLILYHWRAEMDEPAQHGSSEGWYTHLQELSATRALFVAGIEEDWGVGLELAADE